MPCSMASMATELITPLIPGAGPPPTNNANLPGIGGDVMDLPLAHKPGQDNERIPSYQCIERIVCSPQFAPRCLYFLMNGCAIRRSGLFSLSLREGSCFRSLLCFRLVAPL